MANTPKLGSIPIRFLGILKNDKEYEEILPKVRKEWRKWSEKYV